MMIQFATPCSDVAGHQCFGEPYWRRQMEAAVPWSVGILPQHYMMPQSRRPQL